MLVKGLIQQEDTAIVNVYAPNNRSTKYVKAILLVLKVETDCDALVVVDFISPCLSMDRNADEAGAVA